MQYDQRIENIAAVAVNVVKLLVIIYLGVEEVIKISKLLKNRLDPDFDNSREWASQAYAILKKQHEKIKEAEGIEN